VDTFTFWCSYCEKTHIHGAGNGPKGTHCVNLDSSYRKTGYYLVGPGGLVVVPKKNEGSL